MARTRDDIRVGPRWVNLNEAAGIGVGQPMSIQVKSYGSLLLIEDDKEPGEDETRGEVCASLERMSVMEGSLTTWARAFNDKTLRVSVQEV